MAVKLKSLPKRPKASSSPAVWARYEKRLKEVQAENGKKLQADKQKQAIQKRTAGASKVRGKR
ncbi:hypothetical protein [Runella sp.]|uniref:hypothetical protein n=1 Tax=Runella sp. TaxID=1960881 RepID=UPI003D0DECC1